MKMSSPFVNLSFELYYNSTLSGNLRAFLISRGYEYPNRQIQVKSRSTSLKILLVIGH